MRDKIPERYHRAAVELMLTTHGPDLLPDALNSAGQAWNTDDGRIAIVRRIAANEHCVWLVGEEIQADPHHPFWADAERYRLTSALETLANETDGMVLFD